MLVVARFINNYMQYRACNEGLEPGNARALRRRHELRTQRETNERASRQHPEYHDRGYHAEGRREQIPDRETQGKSVQNHRKREVITAFPVSQVPPEFGIMRNIEPTNRERYSVDHRMHSQPGYADQQYDQVDLAGQMVKQALQTDREQQAENRKHPGNDTAHADRLRQYAETQQPGDGNKGKAFQKPQSP